VRLTWLMDTNKSEKTKTTHAYSRVCSVLCHKELRSRYNERISTRNCPRRIGLTCRLRILPNHMSSMM
jgi:hypothetical protein